MDIIRPLLLLADVVDVEEVEMSSTTEAVIGSGAYILFGLAAVLIVAAVVLVIVGTAKRNKK